MLFFILILLSFNFTGCGIIDNNQESTEQLNTKNNLTAEQNESEIIQEENKKQEEKPEVGYLAPNFSFLNEQGTEISLNDLKGKPVFINFWASW